MKSGLLKKDFKKLRVRLVGLTMPYTSDTRNEEIARRKREPWKEFYDRSYGRTYEGKIRRNFDKYQNRILNGFFPAESLDLINRVADRHIGERTREHVSSVAQVLDLLELIADKTGEKYKPVFDYLVFGDGKNVRGFYHIRQRFSDFEKEL